MSKAHPSKIISQIKIFDKYLSHFESALIVVTLGIMIITAFVQVILRNIFNSGILWGDMLVRHLVLWVGFLGAGLATRDNRHISIDALARVLSPAWQRRTQILTNIFATFICILLVKASYTFVKDEFLEGAILLLGIPAWMFMVIILMGFSIITFRFFLKILLPPEIVPASGGE